MTMLMKGEKHSNLFPYIALEWYTTILPGIIFDKYRKTTEQSKLKCIIYCS